MSAVDDPFVIEGPASVSFSGGRSSAYLLHRVLVANGGLPRDVVVLFANTGKEAPETLDFVRDCGERWGVPIVWIEWINHPKPAHCWRVVDYASASRAGEPFAGLIARRRYLPNPVTRFCTSELKVKAMHRYLRATFGWASWVSLLGIRADEPRRVAKISAPNRDRDERVLPLARAGVSRYEVADFWRRQPFDLQLPNVNGSTPGGNCDLCFLKGGPRVLSLIEADPSRALWWSSWEEELGARFRKDRPSYARMLRAVVEQQTFAFDDADIECVGCTD